MSKQVKRNTSKILLLFKLLKCLKLSTTTKLASHLKLLLDAAIPAPDSQFLKFSEPNPSSSFFNPDAR